MKPSHPEPDDALSSLSELAVSSGELHRCAVQLSQWISGSDGRAARSYAHTVPLEQRLTMIEQISRAIHVVTREGNRFRRLEARALYEEGLTAAQLAAVLGVTRQRASALLHADRNDPAADQHCAQSG